MKGWLTILSLPGALLGPLAVHHIFHRSLAGMEPAPLSWIALGLGLFSSVWLYVVLRPRPRRRHD